MQKGDKKAIKSWVFYDWANSAYALVISTAIFPIFYTEITAHYNADGMVHFFNLRFINTEFISYTLSLSYLAVCILSPILSGVADYTGNKLFFLKFFCYMGSISCALLFFFTPKYFELSIIPVFLASIGYWASLVFYNSYLPDIALPEEYDKVSAKGFAMGYLGSTLLLITNLIMIMIFEIPAKWCFLLVAIWWLIFGMVSWKNLPGKVKPKISNVNKFYSGFHELEKVWKEVQLNLPLKKFLISFFVYSMGVQTVMVMATYFGKKEIDWGEGNNGTAGLIISILLIQLIAIGGSIFHSWLSSKIGNKKTMIISLCSWTLICFVAFNITKPIQFYVVASLVGLVMGGIQAMSRSSYSKLLPKTKDLASYFSFFDVTEKFALVFGTFTFGFLERITGSMRSSVLMISLFFIVGCLLMLRVPGNSFKDEIK